MQNANGCVHISIDHINLHLTTYAFKTYQRQFRPLRPLSLQHEWCLMVLRSVGVGGRMRPTHSLQVWQCLHLSACRLVVLAGMDL